MADVRALAASRAAAVRKVAPVSRAYPSGRRLPAGRDGAPSRGTIGCEPIGCPFASRHRAWWRRRRWRNAVISGRPGTRSSASQQCAASSSSLDGASATVFEEGEHPLREQRGGALVVAWQTAVGEVVLVARVEEQLGVLGRLDERA